eukprot:4538740-Pyramimonas_sp.AAC.1
MVQARPSAARRSPWAWAEGGRTSPRAPSRGPRTRTWHVLERRCRFARRRALGDATEPRQLRTG